MGPRTERPDLFGSIELGSYSLHLHITIGGNNQHYTGSNNTRHHPATKVTQIARLLVQMLLLWVRTTKKA